MAEEFKKTAEDMKKAGEEFAKAAGEFDVRGMTKAWKEAYLRGLDSLFQTQEQTEHLVKDAVKQGLAGSQQILTSYEKWLEQNRGQAGVAAPFTDLTRQVVRSVHTTADPLYKTATETIESVFQYYEHAVASPSRKYTYELNKRLMDSIVTE